MSLAYAQHNAAATMHVYLTECVMCLATFQLYICALCQYSAAASAGQGTSLSGLDAVFMA